MCGVAEKIKDGRRICVGGLKEDLFCAAPQVEAIEIAHDIILPIDVNHALAADIQHAQLAALHKVVCPQRLIRAKRDRRGQRRSHAYNGPIQIDIR